MKPVLIIWKDAHAATETWTDIDDVEDNEPYIVNSVGIFLAIGAGGKKGHVSICQSFTQDRFVDAVLHIPKKMVIKVVDLSSEGEPNGEAAAETRDPRNHGISEAIIAPRFRG
jgi:hypothetical protein